MRPMWWMFIGAVAATIGWGLASPPYKHQVCWYEGEQPWHQERFR